MTHVLALHSSCADIMDTCSFGRYDIARLLTSETQEWLPQKIEPSFTLPDTHLFPKVVFASGSDSPLPLSICRVQQPSPDTKPWETNYQFLILNIIMDQMHTDLRSQDYLQSSSSKPCPLHTCQTVFGTCFPTDTQGFIHYGYIHLVMRESRKWTEAGATWARAGTWEGEVL